MNSNNWKRFLFHLRREFLLQLDGRKSYARGVYPGVSWFGLLCAAVLLFEFNQSRNAPQRSETALTAFAMLACGQCVLIWLRATVYCALSFSRDLKNQSVTVVKITPVSASQTLLAKLAACLAPLWIELLLFLPVSVLFFCVYLAVPIKLVLALTPFLLAVSLCAGCMGLAIGSLSSQPAQAIRNARLFTFFLLFFVPVLHGMSDSESWFLPLAALGLWLLIYSRRAPNRGLFMASAIGITGFLALLERFQPAGIEMNLLHPAKFVSLYFSNSRLKPEDYLYLHPDFQDQTSTMMDLYAFPVSVSLVYAVLAIACFWLARTRFRYS